MLQAVSHADDSQQDLQQSGNFDLLDLNEVLNIEQERRDIQEHLREAMLRIDDSDLRVLKADGKKKGSEKEDAEDDSPKEEEPWWMKFEAARLSESSDDSDLDADSVAKIKDAGDSASDKVDKDKTDKLKGSKDVGDKEKNSVKTGGSLTAKSAKSGKEKSVKNDKDVAEKAEKEGSGRRAADMDKEVKGKGKGIPDWLFNPDIDKDVKDKGDKEGSGASSASEATEDEVVEPDADDEEEDQ